MALLEQGIPLSLLLDLAFGPPGAEALADERPRSRGPEPDDAA